MQQRHPKLTKENFLFRIKEKSTTAHIPQTEHVLTIIKCYMFITILEVLTDQQKPNL